MTVRPTPREAIEALEVWRQRIAMCASCRGPVVLRVDDAVEAPRPVEWCVIVDGVVVASSQPWLVGQRREA